MERLPDFLMLDFCEWLKRTILNKAQYSNIDMWDLLFDERYEKFLLEKTEEYCNRERKQKNPNSNDNIKKILNEVMRMYYESDEFQDLCYRIRQEYYPREYLFHGFQSSFKHFEYSLSDKMPRFFKERCDCNRQHLSPYALIDNLRYYYRDSLSKDQEQNPILQLMVGKRKIWQRVDSKEPADSESRARCLRIKSHLVLHSCAAFQGSRDCTIWGSLRSALFAVFISHVR